jgi:hypothetical protein
MSHSLPQEILDLIIDRLHDKPATLKACCLVSKAWVQRAQKHLFIRIEFNPITCPVRRWRETFPDHTNSPAYNTRTLSFRIAEFITSADVDTLLTFRNVTHLDVENISPLIYQSPLVSLHGIFTAIKSLRLASTVLSDPQVFGFLSSLPLLEDLALVTRLYRSYETWTRPPTSPKLTGTLELHANGGIESITHRLLDLPNGLHFRRVVVRLFSPQDVGSMMDLVSRCSDTLESLGIIGIPLGAFHPTPAPSQKLIFAQIRRPQSTSPEQPSLKL